MAFDYRDLARRARARVLDWIARIFPHKPAIRYVLVGFVIVPLRMGYMDFRGFDPGISPALSSLSFLPAFLLLIVIRRGALLKAPVLSKYLRAYRRASLLKARDDANKALAKLDAIEERKAAA